jgi:hypothetical protein
MSTSEEREMERRILRKQDLRIMPWYVHTTFCSGQRLMDQDHRRILVELPVRYQTCIWHDFSLTKEATEPTWEMR